MSLRAHHVGSLDRFADLGAQSWGVVHALDLALEPLAISVAASVAAPMWLGSEKDGVGFQWAAPLSLEAPGAGSVEVLVPWLVTDDAGATAPHGLRLGAHWGTWLDRPRLPVASLVRTPGARLLTRPSTKGTSSVELELQPRFGAACRVRMTDDGPVARFDLPELEPQARTHDAEAGAATTAGVGGPLDGAELARRVAAHGFHIDGGALDASVTDVTGARRESSRSALTEDDATALLAALAAAVESMLSGGGGVQGVLGPLDPAARHLSFYGDQLLAETYRAARAAVREARSAGETSPAVVLALVGRQLGDAYAALGSGGATSVAVERLTGTVARAEAERRVSLIGPDGLPALRGRLDLRTLDESWRETLCPVHTPESTKVGLVRHAALGAYPLAPDSRAADLFGDVSIAAALVPFLNHDDPTRAAIVTKMFGQALRVEGAQAPAVRTGMETLLAEAGGVVRARTSGRVRQLSGGTLRVADDAVRFGPAGDDTGDQEGVWTVVAGERTTAPFVAPGALLAHAPDVVVEADGAACLAPGLDALVAFLPWDGWNYEDGIVVSAAFAERAASHHLRTVTARVLDGADIEESVPTDRYHGVIQAGTALAVVLPPGDRSGEPVTVDESCTLVLGGDPGFDYTTVRDGLAQFRVRVRRPLRVGDKLTTRHGGKGVVTRIEPVEAMPRLPDGTRIDVLLNPLGVLRRLNTGTYLEAAVALRRRLSGDPAPVVVPRALGRAALRELAEDLAALGAVGGRLPLVAADGTRIGPEEGVVVGDLHILKLVHRAEAKASGSREASASPVSLQPARSGRRGTPQRLGEMELWALQAVGARETLLDLLRVRGEGRPELRGLEIAPAGMRAAMAHLATAGVQIGAETEHGPVPLWRQPATPVGTITAVTVGTGASGLRDIFELMPTSGASPRRAARAMLAAALAESAAPDEPVEPGAAALRGDAGRALSQETVRFTIPLPRPVEHPWALRRGAATPAVLWEVPVLPPAFFLPEAAAAHDRLRRRYEDLLASVVQLRRAIAFAARPGTAPDRNGEAPGVELGAGHDAAGEPRSGRDDAGAVLPDEARVSGSIGRLLGRLGHGPADGTIAGRLSGKYGILRRNLLGVSAVRSGRAVLVGDPTLGIEEVGLPVWLLDDLGVPRTPATGHADVVILNRQPTLHPYNVVALRAVASPHDAVTIHPYHLQAIAGDFDGDTAAVHRPMGERARAEIWTRCRPAATLFSARDGQPLAKRDLDVAVGLHVLTEGDEHGRQLLAARDGGGLHGGPGVANRVTALVTGILSADDPVDSRLERVAELMRAGWRGAQRWGFSVVDLAPLERREAEEPADTVRRVLADATTAPLLRLRQAFEAGAAGGATDLAQLLVERGEVRLPTGRPRPDGRPPVTRCYLEGLDTADYFAAAQPSIAGLAAKKLVTPFAGSLTKRLVELGYDAVIGADDCGWVAGGGGTERSPLSCRHPETCRACYEARAGREVAHGDRVGVLAGMLIGERSTQLAMKSIHQRGSQGNLKGDVQRLERVFARGSTLDADAAVGEFELLLQTVNTVHAQVLVRARTARLLRGPLVRAARRGDLAPLVRAALTGRPDSPREVVADDHLLRLILGVPE